MNEQKKTSRGWEPSTSRTKSNYDFKKIIRYTNYILFFLSSQPRAPWFYITIFKLDKKGSIWVKKSILVFLFVSSITSSFYYSLKRTDGDIIKSIMFAMYVFAIKLNFFSSKCGRKKLLYFHRKMSHVVERKRSWSLREGDSVLFYIPRSMRPMSSFSWWPNLPKSDFNVQYFISLKC